MEPGCGVAVRFAAGAGEVEKFAAEELRGDLGAMLGVSVAVGQGEQVDGAELTVTLAAPPRTAASAAPDDSFTISRRGREIVLGAGCPRGLLHAAYDLLEQLGARFPLGRAPDLPRIDRRQLLALGPRSFAPAFHRRAFASDIMTWHYLAADRLALHLEHDREFIPWMARHAVNAFSFIRHASDSVVRIDELVPYYRERGIAAEYGGHVLQLLLPRERFASRPEYFPLGADGSRMARGNLCVSSREALELVRANALRYVIDYPENALLHIWGADVEGGAWCRCAGCAALSPQLQYLKVVNAIAEGLVERRPGGPPVAYLAYHDTIDPDPRLEPRANVWFEWAPRERCYSHAIDDPECETNPRYWRSLNRYLEIFQDRGHVFEYYADAILFGGLGFATPSTVAADLRAYHRLGLRSISCLTFGAFSVLAYPVNLLAFVRGARALDFQPLPTLADAAAERHPACAAEMETAYRALAEASALVLTYGEVMRPRLGAEARARKRTELAAAGAAMRRALEAAEHVRRATSASLVEAECELWQYSVETMAGLGDYLAGGGEAAFEKLEAALAHIRAIELALKGTWGAYDLERFHNLWLAALRRRPGGS